MRTPQSISRVALPFLPKSRYAAVLALPDNKAENVPLGALPDTDQVVRALWDKERDKLLKRTFPPPSRVITIMQSALHALGANGTMPLALAEPGKWDATRLGHRLRLAEGDPGLAIAGDAECRLAIDLVERLSVD